MRKKLLKASEGAYEPGLSIECAEDISTVASSHDYYLSLLHKEINKKYNASKSKPESEIDYRLMQLRFGGMQ